MTDESPKVVSLAEARAVRVAKLKREKRLADADAAEKAVKKGWKVHFTTCGEVMLVLDWKEENGDEWELTECFAPEKARALSRALSEFAMHAERQREKNDRIVSLVWSRPDGEWACGESVDGVVTGFVGDAAMVEPSRPEDSHRIYWRDGKHVFTPPHGWPSAGLYSLATGAPIDVQPRRRHWRISHRDLEYLREQAEAARR